MASYTFNINGEIRSSEHAFVTVLDRGFLYGDSVYEVLRTYGGRLFALEEHLARFDRSAASLEMALPPRDTIERELERTLGAAACEEVYCRIIATRGSGPLTLDPAAAIEPQLVIIVKPFEPFAEALYARGAKVAVPGWRRTADPAVKSGNYVNSVLALGQARRRGFDDALLVNASGHVTEGVSSNVFIIDQGRLVTPPLDAGLLAGVTRRFLIDLARDAGLLVAEHPLPVERVASAKEVMLTSTLREVLPVTQVEASVIGDGRPGPIVQRLRALLRDFARARCAGPKQP